MSNELLGWLLQYVGALMTGGLIGGSLATIFWVKRLRAARGEIAYAQMEIARATDTLKSVVQAARAGRPI